MDKHISSFCYKSFIIDKSQSLGRGSYGTVFKASCDELPCAAKVLHPTIVHTLDPGSEIIMKRFEKECKFLSEIRHPNIVQCLGVSWDADSRLPALFMELLDESLTRMLERSPQPLQFCVQVDICHDIALALAYLHSNGVIHRDLSSNNILVIAGRRAKVTDFGMVKLATSASPTQTAVPGTQVYMPPEALQDPPHYSMKLDCFSQGVLIIQVCTRLYPAPGPRTQRKASVQPLPSPTGTVDVPVLETDRRKSHLDLIDASNPLLLVAIDCLNYHGEMRPSAADLCQRIACIKKESEYIDSKDKQTHDSQDTGDHQVDELQQQLREQQQLNLELQNRIDELEHEKETKDLSLDPVNNVVFKWKDVHSASPFKMIRGAAVIDEDNAYFLNTTGEACVYNSKSCEWSVLPPCPLFGSSLAVVNDLLTAVGGEENSAKSSGKLISLVNKEGKKEWVTQTQFNPIPTPRSFAAVVSIKNSLIVAGGRKGRQYGQTYFNTVEIMNTETGQWSGAARLPYPYSRMSMTVCRNKIYMLGGFGLTGRVRSVVSCSVDALLESQTWGSWIRSGMLLRPVWNVIAKVPTYHFATCVTIRDELFAVGGCSSRDDTIHTNIIHKYNMNTKSWEITCEMPRSVERCLAVVLPTNELMVVGGGVYAQHDQGSNFVSIAKLI